MVFFVCLCVKEFLGKCLFVGYFIMVCCLVILLENFVVRLDNDGFDNDDRVDDRDDRL